MGILQIMTNPLNDILTFLHSGGNVLIVLMISSIIFWTLMVEKFLYFKFVFRPESKKLRKYWKENQESDAWENLQVKHFQISNLNMRLQMNLPTIKVLIALFPLMGLLGTVTGMISVFDSMSSMGTNARAMASGISMATIPTMAGMLLAVLGIFAFSRADFMIKKEIRKLKDKLLKDSDA